MNPKFCQYCNAESVVYKIVYPDIPGVQYIGSKCCHKILTNNPAICEMTWIGDIDSQPSGL